MTKTKEIQKKHSDDIELFYIAIEYPEWSVSAGHISYWTGSCWGARHLAKSYTFDEGYSRMRSGYCSDATYRFKGVTPFLEEVKDG